ncbi:nucleotide-binding domain-containing protein [Pseudomonas aeruginosa]|uniref:nucleotide-binding domain-containing protein n=1 Tax=Pseudomonas aeruginosa TaxID=287 RepID=UPI001CD4AE64|nr:adenylate/guanylate cyclase domain-containing protein [Pseudomonas aeruginosa]MDP5587712.1 adenylate/guanylate cyclase domain-containing protein [Pseudomonas aeruginosa]WGX18694.1 adenylate/guanylate cyclase domain-containing protein [Pseudomonas aeruginosa]
MQTLKDLYGDVGLHEKLRRKTLKKSFETFDSNMVLESIQASVSRSQQLQQENFNIIPKIRGLFGKTGAVESAIGGHPHFNYLAESGGQQYGYTVSLFMDIKGSTRLGIIYSPEDVFYIKNAIIRCAIETIQAFDGHVHRIMGDAVLAFFRSNGSSPRNSAIDAINCGTYLVEFMKEVVLPHLQENNLDEDIGIRVGIDYGDNKNVLWGMYGYRGSHEVTATSFHVDVAAKLQQKAPRNRVMIGQSIKELLDLHNGIIENRYIIRNGETVPLPYVRPNHKDDDGNAINYQQFVINHKAYFDLLPKPEDADRLLTITSTLKPNKDSISDIGYASCSRAVEKPYGVDFKVKFRLNAESGDDIKVRFRVENHGAEAFEIKEPLYSNHDTVISPSLRSDGTYFAKQWEGTSYTGLHYMCVSVLQNGRVAIPETLFGVYVGNQE